MQHLEGESNLTYIVRELNVCFQEEGELTITPWFAMFARHGQYERDEEFLGDCEGLLMLWTCSPLYPNCPPNSLS